MSPGFEPKTFGTTKPGLPPIKIFSDLISFANMKQSKIFHRILRGTSEQVLKAIFQPGWLKSRKLQS